MSSDFEKKIMENFVNKGLGESSIAFYTRNLKKLNGDKKITSFNFLKDVEKTLEKLKDKKENTQRGYIISIVSALSSEPKLKALYTKYYDILKKVNTELKDKESKNEKSETQKENWIDWEEVKKIYSEYDTIVKTFEKKKTLTKSEYYTLLEFVVLSLYTLSPPRRNKDYQNMFLVKGKLPKEEDKNYLDVKKGQFIFNDYKTKDTYGSQTVDIPEELQKNIKLYLKHYPNKEIKEKSIILPFLVDSEGNQLKNVNSITLLLNKIFKKKVGSSLLRSIYLSDKYGDTRKEQLKDAKEMANSVNVQQSNYVKIK